MITAQEITDSTNEQAPQLTAELMQLLVDVAQIFDGWHADGTAWTEWDESVRRRISQFLNDAVLEQRGILTERLIEQAVK